MCLFYVPASNFTFVSQMFQYLSRESEKLKKKLENCDCFFRSYRKHKLVTLLVQRHRN